MSDKLVDHLRKAAPELVEQFDNEYEQPMLRSSCSRCGVSTAVLFDHTIHLEWHYNLSLSIYAIGSALKSILGKLETE